MVKRSHDLVGKVPPSLVVYILITCSDILHLLNRLIQVNTGSMYSFHVLKIKSNQITKGPKGTLGDGCLWYSLFMYCDSLTKSVTKKAAEVFNFV